MSASLPSSPAEELARVRRFRAQTDLLKFTHYTYPGYLSNWFHREVCDALEWFYTEVQAKRSPRLMLTAPPRHGKSELVSIRFPAWTLGRDPDLSFIATSYADDLAGLMNRGVQRVLDSEEYRELFPDTKLGTGRGAVRTADLFEVVGHAGRYRSAGVGGGITGMGAHVLLIDDPVKDHDQANSKTYRAKVWDWYTSTAYTRLAPGGGVLIIQTRWHEDDLAGRLLDAEKRGEGDSWRVINFPAVAERDEKHRKKGEALHPERYPLQYLDKVRRQGSRVWQSLYQQAPAPDKGNRFDRSWWRFYRKQRGPNDLSTAAGRRPKGCNELPTVLLPYDHRFTETVQSWDMTFKDTDGSDFVVGAVIAREGARRYVRDISRDQRSFVNTVKEVKAVSEQYPDAYAKLVEDKANGPAVISQLEGEIAGLIAVNPQGGKESRAAAMEPQVEAGNWFLPEGEPWVDAFVEEFAVFPFGKNDDQVDACSQAEIRFLESESDSELYKP